MYRFQAMRVSNYEHFKPTFKSFKTGFLCVVAPILVMAYVFQWERKGKEDLYRTGQVAYKDRLFKFI
jgi:NADH dehydrogenase (ubiquinone) 1 beta subcomplex subunit 4